MDRPGFFFRMFISPIKGMIRGKAGERPRNRSPDVVRPEDAPYWLLYCTAQPSTKADTTSSQLPPAEYWVMAATTPARQASTLGV